MNRLHYFTSLNYTGKYRDSWTVILSRSCSS